MGWLTDIVVSRLPAQQGTTGGTSHAVTRPRLRGAGLEPYTGKGSSLTVAVGRRPLASPAPRSVLARGLRRNKPEPAKASGKWRNPHPFFGRTRQV